jgi:hypothetical protein
MADIQFPAPGLSGTLTATVVDNDNSPATVLDANRPFTVLVGVTLNQLAATLLSGNLAVSVYAESVGPGPEIPISGGVITLASPQSSYTLSLTVSGNTLPPNPVPPTNSGVYKIVTVLTRKNAANDIDVAAVEEGPVVWIG